METAALLIDFENIYVHLAKDTGGKRSASDLALQWLRALKEHIGAKLDENLICQDAYADFERIPEDVQGDLYLLGIETHNVLGTDHKNAADMRLCIDALEMLYTRPAIASFVLAAGDRDYIPLIRHLRKQDKTVRVALRVNDVETVSLAIITEQGEVRTQHDQESGKCGFGAVGGRRGT